MKLTYKFELSLDDLATVRLALRFARRDYVKNLRSLPLKLRPEASLPAEFRRIYRQLGRINPEVSL